MIRRLSLISATAILALALPATARAENDSSKLIAQSKVPALLQPAAPMPSPDVVVIPPHITGTFATRADGQPDMLWEDLHPNMTDYLSRYYFDPRWRGESWAPYQTYWIVERASHMMSSWPEYDNFSTIRVFNGWHKFWEKYSGFGP